MLFKNQCRYFFFEILKNKFVFWPFCLLALILTIVLPLAAFPKSSNPINEDGISNLIANSYLYFVFQIALLLIFLVASTYILFGASKDNNVDLYNNVRPIKRWKTALAKELSIFGIGSILNLFICCIVLVVLVSSKQAASGMSFKFAAISFFGNLVVMLVFLMIMSAIGIHFKSLVGLIVNALVIIISLACLIVPRFLVSTQSMSLSFDKKQQQNNYLKIYSFKDDDTVERIDYAKQRDFSDAPEVNGIANNNYSDKLKGNPFNFMMATSSGIWNSSINPSISKAEIIKIVDNGTLLSTINPIISEVPLMDSGVNLASKNWIEAPIDKQTIFDIKDKVQRFEAIAESLKKEPLINKSFKDNDVWNLLYKKIQHSTKWLDIGLNDNEKQAISHIAGLTINSEILYDIIAHNDISKKYLTGIDEYFKSIGLSDSLIKLIEFIWNDPISSSNLLSQKLDFVDIDEVYRFHPKLQTTDEQKEATPYDLNYIKNNEFIFDVKNGVITLKVLDADGVPTLLPNPEQIFGNVNISNTNDYENFFNQHSTIAELKKMINTAQLQLKTGDQVKRYDFHKNVSDLYSVDSILDVSTAKTDAASFSYLALFISLGLALNAGALMRLTRKDLI